MSFVFLRSLHSLEMCTPDSELAAGLCWPLVLCGLFELVRRINSELNHFSIQPVAVYRI